MEATGLGRRSSQAKRTMSVAMRILDHAQSRIPQPWRTIVDWFVTIAVAVAFVLTFQAQIAKPYRIARLRWSQRSTARSQLPTAKGGSVTA